MMPETKDITGAWWFYDKYLPLCCLVYKSSPIRNMIERFFFTLVSKMTVFS